MSPYLPASDIPLGVECAWPGAMSPAIAVPAPRQARLTEAWHRLLAALQTKRRANWSR